MPGLGWPYPFRQRSWAEVRHDVLPLTTTDDYLIRIIDSVIDAGADEVLAVTTSMSDLVVAPKPATDVPLDVVVVYAPTASMSNHPAGTVRIAHVSGVGKDTQIIRPSEEAVPLFWRFLDVEFGVRSRS